jgi:hypothetical protein
VAGVTRGAVGNNAAAADAAKAIFSMDESSLACVGV